jgi:hypothetical protein
LVPSTVETRKYRVVDGSASTGPTFFTVSFTVIGCPWGTVDGGLLSELMIRSGACSTVISPTAIVQ